MNHIITPHGSIHSIKTIIDILQSHVCIDLLMYKTVGKHYLQLEEYRPSNVCVLLVKAYSVVSVPTTQNIIMFNILIKK